MSLFQKKPPELRFRLPVVVASFFSLSVTVLIFLLFYSEWFIHATLLDQIQARQLASARAIAQGIDWVMNDMRGELLWLAEDEDIQTNRSSRSQAELVRVMKHLAEKNEYVRAVVRLGPEGEIWWDVNAEGVTFPAESNLSDRDYFLWARDLAKPGDVFLTEPFVAGKKIIKGPVVLLVTPVFDGDEFNGLIFASIHTETLTRGTLGALLPRGLEAQGAVVSRQGMVIGSTVRADCAGQSISECLPEGVGEADPENFARTFLLPREGSLEHEYYFFADAAGQSRKMTTSFSSTTAPRVNWTVLVSSPVAEVNQYLRFTRLVLGIGMAISVAGLILAVAMVVPWQHAACRRAFVEGFREARKR